MATKKVSSVIDSVEYVPSGINSEGKHYEESYIITVGSGTKLPWLTQKFMDNWFVRNQINPAFTPAQVMTDAGISWEERAVKEGEPALDRKGKEVFDAAGNQVFYTKDHVRIENIVIAPNLFIAEKITDALIGMVAKQQFESASPAERARKMLADKQAARAAAQKASAAKAAPVVDPALEPAEEGFTPELSEEQQLEMSKQALENPTTV